MTVRDLKRLIARIHNLEDNISSSVAQTVYRSVVEPEIPWNREKIEKLLAVTLPSELVQFWDLCSGVRIYEDISYGQWGSIIWSPEKVVDNQVWKTTRFFNNEDFYFGDIIIGEFRGDSALALIIRCDRTNSDFGSIIIASSIDPRDYWYLAAPSLDIHLEKLLAAQGAMYWEHGFNFDEDIKKWLSGDV